MPEIRLDKLLTHMNCGSRREVGAMIRAGRVTVEGEVIRDPAYKIQPDTAAVALDGARQQYRAQRYYMLNKPGGVVTANQDPRHRTYLDLFPEAERRGLFAIGRLDKDTEGLLLVTDDGPLSHALSSPSRHVEKEYVAQIDGSLCPDAAERFRKGIALKDGTVCRPARLEVLGGTPVTVRVTLCEGKYHQVKRMIAAAGAVVTHLRRERVGPLTLDSALPPGCYRALTEEEAAALIGGAAGKET